MSGFSDKNKKLIWVLTLCLITLAGLWWLYFKPAKEPSFSPEIMARSRQLADDLERRDPGGLTFEDQLTLLHACSNLQRDDCVLKTGYAVLDKIENLPAERKKPFIAMIEKAKKRQGFTF